VTAGGPPPVTVINDKDDHPDWTAAAHTAHDPGLGRLTIDPSPANGAPAALAHDLLYALGKRLPHGGETHGTWADSQRPAWDAACAWTLAHHIGHLIVCRTDRLTHTRFRQLLTLRERSGIRLTLLWHRPVSPTLTTLLDETPHHIIDTLPHARVALEQTGRFPAEHPNSEPTPCQDDGQWITPRAPLDGVVVDRLARTPCQGVPAVAPDNAAPPKQNVAPPKQEDGRTPRDVLAARLTTVAHPLHAAALTIHTITAADIDRLALIRGIDIDESTTVVKVHDSKAHRRCRLYPLPTWARPLIQAARIHGQIKDRAPDSPLFPLISARDGKQLTLTATGIRYAFGPIR
jgi:hypothetical protein